MVRISHSESEPGQEGGGSGRTANGGSQPQDEPHMDFIGCCACWWIWAWECGGLDPLLAWRQGKAGVQNSGIQAMSLVLFQWRSLGTIYVTEKPKERNKIGTSDGRCSPAQVFFQISAVWKCFVILFLRKDYMCHGLLYINALYKTIYCITSGTV